MARRAASMLVAFESLTNRTPPISADRLERMLEPGESLDGLGHRRGVDADNRGHRGRREHVGEQVTAEQLHRRQRYERLFAARRPPHNRIVREHHALAAPPRSSRTAAGARAWPRRARVCRDRRR